MKVAVIGAGAFGSATASKLAQNGYQVVLFEKNDDILQGATPNSQNRLHLGLHYPRDLQTAKQSVIGFDSFINSYGECVNLDFPNFYAIPKNGSKVTKEEFEEFAKKSDIAMVKVDPEDFNSLGITIKNVSGIWQCNEGVIDMNIFKRLLTSQLLKSNVELRLSTEITKLRHSQGKWIVTSKQGNDELFDTVVSCTYSHDSIDISAPNYEAREVLFQQTLIQVLESNIPRIGLTIVDGDYLTILPRGFSGQQLAYGPTISTRRSERATRMPKSWEVFAAEEIDIFQKELRERIDAWVEDWSYDFTSETLETIRTIEPDVEKTDRRTSKITRSAQGLIEVWAGKIDHCVDISDKILKDIQSQ